MPAPPAMQSATPQQLPKAVAVHARSARPVSGPTGASTDTSGSLASRAPASGGVVPPASPAAIVPPLMVIPPVPPVARAPPMPPVAVVPPAAVVPPVEFEAPVPPEPALPAEPGASGPPPGASAVSWLSTATRPSAPPSMSRTHFQSAVHV